jgi:hypothetical protein
MRGIIYQVQKRGLTFVFSLFTLVMLHCACEAQCGLHRGQVISCADLSLNGAQKYVLKVDGKPFYMTNIQIRLDKLRYYWGWDVAARDAIVAQAAADGFNTISIPIQWYEVEPQKNKFDWTILDEYLGLAQKHGLKMELLWFGQNSGGHVQWLGAPFKNPVHLRTPDYVLYSAKPGSNSTTSDYTIRRDMSDYTLDLADNRLRERETYVLSQVMAHIASWDAAHGSKHTVIGVQLDNEVRGMRKMFPASLVISYMSAVGSAVKNSAYVVWTRMNCVYSDTVSRIDANETLRSNPGTNIDFVGIDIYAARSATDAAYVTKVATSLPFKGGNYRMVMECGAEVDAAAIVPMAALFGNTAVDYYDMIGPDGHGLYDRNATAGFIPHGAYVTDVRLVNKLLDSDMVDIATNAQGRRLFVHNWMGDSTTATTGVDGIGFIPNSSASQAISIERSNTEIVLMNTHGGTFTYPVSLGINNASKGYFDSHNRWVDEGRISFTQKSISPPVGTTIRLTRSAPSEKIRQSGTSEVP